MTAIIIGVAMALAQILLFELLKQFDKKSIYSLILCAIGFLYVGFTWTDTSAFLIASVQAIIFLFIGYFGLAKSNLMFIALGYFLHGLWDISYGFWQDTALLPPNYDVFCMSLDFLVGIYLIFKAIKFKGVRKNEEFEI
ncbi:hypothetical protein EZL74_03810 [Flavobacterium silvisoli]|uniref:Uncharacterized protein n=1 Tax=Flavobacterium silvisoli TaxID=2529433 RepID=A0A4V2L5E3_9FLAO|nr:DUF6010 family protein [Flavobacterium silvisoli]TBX70311.1 hypothetical protein EZL74_03810 [Flavobacterium silvisoli]